MMEIVFVVCLSTEPTRCDDKTLQFADMPLMACVMHAQTVLAQWSNEHPGWEIQCWTCRQEDAGS